MRGARVTSGGERMPASAVRPAPRHWWLAGALCVIAASSACSTSFAYLRLPPDERRLFDIYSPLMTSAQDAEYLGRRTTADRAAYAAALGLRGRFLALSDDERQAVRERRLARGMSADAVRMSWGDPYYTFGIGEQAEEWVYFPYLSHHPEPSVGYRVYLRHARVEDWQFFVVPVGERP